MLCVEAVVKGNPVRLRRPTANTFSRPPDLAAHSRSPTRLTVQALRKKTDRPTYHPNSADTFHGRDGLNNDESIHGTHSARGDSMRFTRGGLVSENFCVYLRTMVYRMLVVTGGDLARKDFLCVCGKLLGWRCPFLVVEDRFKNTSRSIYNHSAAFIRSRQVSLQAAQAREGQISVGGRTHSPAAGDDATGSSRSTEREEWTPIFNCRVIRTGARDGPRMS